nr:1-deoxy-D-xylulose-5-phosphate reductoisomerase [Dehalococcoidia bacterium]
SLAYEALSRGGTATAALNVANDNSVRLFLDGKIGFTQIAKINEAALSEHKWIADPDLKDLLELEEWGKSFVELEMKESLTV